MNRIVVDALDYEVNTQSRRSGSTCRESQFSFCHCLISPMGSAARSSGAATEGSELQNLVEILKLAVYGNSVSNWNI